MLVTEQQAKDTMWCPMVRIRWQARPVVFNRSNPGAKARLYNHIFRTFFPRLHYQMRGKYFRCAGSGCMMWRWQDPAKLQRRRGYCGLAGTPAFGLLDAQMTPGDKS
jgi:hypothetical protein